MKTTMAMTMMVVIGALLPGVTSGQQAEGIRPLTPDLVPEVMAVGQQEYKLFYSDLGVLRMKARTDRKAPEGGPYISDAPWDVTITTPFLRGADVVQDVRRTLTAATRPGQPCAPVRLPNAAYSCASGSRWPPIQTESIFRVLRISVSGFAPSTRKSASLPRSIVPS